MDGTIDMIRILASSRVLIGLTLVLIAYIMISKLYIRNKSRMLIISKFLIGYLWLNIALVITRSFHKNYSTINIRKVAFLLISIVLIYSLYYFTSYINDQQIFNLDGIDENETNILKIYGHFVYFTMSILSTATLGDTLPNTLNIKFIITTQYIVGLSIFTILITKAL
jgi:hypothetical protein